MKYITMGVPPLNGEYGLYLLREVEFDEVFPSKESITLMGKETKHPLLAYKVREILAETNARVDGWTQECRFGELEPGDELFYLLFLGSEEKARLFIVIEDLIPSFELDWNVL